MSFGRVLRVWALASVAMVLIAGVANALTADGVLITNQAWGTYRITAGTGQNITYAATANVLVATPAIQMKKTSSATIQVAGGIVTFCLSFSNASAYASAVNVVVADKIPDNMRFSDPGGNLSFANDPPGGVMTTTWSSTAVGPWTAGYPPSGQGGAGVYLRWTTDVVGPRASGYMCYTVTIL